MESFNFTQAAIKALPDHPAARTRYKDTGQRGLIVAVSPGGSKVFYLFKRHRGHLHERRLGEFPAMGVVEARGEAVRMIAAIEAGDDPMAAAGRPKHRDKTFGELFEWWEKTHASKGEHWENRDASAYRLHLAPALADRQLRLITKDEARQLHAAIAAKLHRQATEKAKESSKKSRQPAEDVPSDAGRRTANKAIAHARAAWNMAIDHDVTNLPNPFDAVKLFPAARRRRRLTEAEAPRFFGALSQASPLIRDFVLLLLFTGQRRGDVLDMRWDAIDLDERTWYLPVTKNEEDQMVPLEDIEVGILRARWAAREPYGDARDEYVFPSRAGSARGYMTEPKNGWAALLKRAGLEDFRMHDLRRTNASWLLREGAAMKVVSKAMGHSSTDVTEQVYALMDLDPVRLAKQKGLGALAKAGKFVMALPKDDD